MSSASRYLEGRPILARPQTALYIGGKFLRRRAHGPRPDALARLGRTDENLQLLQAAVDETRRGELKQALATFNELLDVYKDDPSAGDLQASRSLYEKSVEGYRRCAGADSRGTLTEQEFLAGVLVQLDRGPEALAIMTDILPKWRQIYGTDPGPDFSEPLNFMAMAELATGHAVEAEAHAKEMVAVQTGKVDAQDRRFGASHLLWARALMQQGRFADALPHARIADSLLAERAVSAGAKQMGAEAHQVLRELELRNSAAAP